MSEVDEKQVPTQSEDISPAAPRPGPTVAFPPSDENVAEEKPVRPRGIEMRRELTTEDKELAQAGYEHLVQEKKEKSAKDGDMDKVDIVEHKMTPAEVAAKFNASIDLKNPGQSQGLTAKDAAERLQRDGPNVLTPPKKKSALRKVSVLFIED
jgi:sodium/potassium-transporting ATPase subunit alpha